MIDKRQVMYDIERCVCHVPDACRDCSHYTGTVGFGCMENLMSDALALLKAQEEKEELQKEEMAGVDAAFDKIISDMQELVTPRLLTPDDFNNNSMVDECLNLPAWVEYREFSGFARPTDGWTVVNKSWVDGYRDRRFWTSRPTDEQREAVKWE